MYFELLPPTALADRIDCVWFQNNHSHDNKSILRIPPDGAIDLIFDVAAHCSYWVGATAKSITVYPIEIRHAYGIRFAPGCASSLLGLPAASLTGLKVAAFDLGKNYEHILEKLSVSTDSITNVEFLYGWVRDQFLKFPPNQLIMSLVQEIRKYPYHLGMEKRAEALGLSRQYLTRMCKRHIGLDAKTFQRTQRLQSILKTVPAARSHTGDWSELALAFGYFDQSHFINDFRALTGETPAVFFPNKVPFFQDHSKLK